MNRPQLHLPLRPRPSVPSFDGQAPRVRSRPRSTAPRERRLGSGWRRLTRPLPLTGIALIAVALLGYLLVAAQASRRSEILVAAHPLPAGTRLTRTDLTATRLAGNTALIARLVPMRDETAVVGRRLATTVPTGVPVALADLAPAGGGPAAFTLTVSYLDALGGQLQPGDRVTVLATFTNAAGTSTARVIARGLEVLTVGVPPTGIDQTTSTIPVTVALPDPSQSAQLALANSVGKIDLLRDGANTGTAIPPATATGAGAGT